MWTWESPMLAQKCTATNQPLLRFVKAGWWAAERERLIEVVSPSTLRSHMYLYSRWHVPIRAFAMPVQHPAPYFLWAAAPQPAHGAAPPFALFSPSGGVVRLHWWQTWGLMFALSVQTVPWENHCKLSLLLFRVDNMDRWRRLCFIVSSLKLAVHQNRQYLRTGCTSELAVAAALSCY